MINVKPAEVEEKSDDIDANDEPYFMVPGAYKMETPINIFDPFEFMSFDPPVGFSSNLSLDKIENNTDLLDNVEVSECEDIARPEEAGGII